MLQKLKKIMFTNFTILIIPQSTRSTKQVRLNAGATYALIIGFIIVNIIVSIASVTYYSRSQQLDTANNVLTSEVESNLELISHLENKTTLQSTEINQLSEDNQEVLDYLNTRIAEVNDLYTEMATTIATFNEENNSDISVPISRALDRTSIRAIENYKNTDNAEAAPDLEEQEKQDELSTVITTMKDTSAELKTEIEEQLAYLDCLPNHLPLEGYISSGFGYRIHPISGLRSFHYGIDIKGDRNTPVESAGSGLVTFAGWSGSFGKVVIISHGYGYETVYAHNNSIEVAVGDWVEKGQVISKVGNTGRSTGPHLHFEVHYNDKAVNPIGVLKYDN